MLRFQNNRIDTSGLPGVEPTGGFWLNGQEPLERAAHQDTETILRRAIERAFDQRSVVIRKCRVSFERGHVVIEGEVEPPVRPSGARGQPKSGVT